MKKLTYLLFAILLFTSCGNGHKKTTNDRLAEDLIEKYPEINHSELEYNSAVEMAQSEAKSWIGSMPKCLDEEDFFFSRCINVYGQTYGLFHTTVGCASNKDARLSLMVYVLVPVDMQTASTLINDNQGPINTRDTPLPHYYIKGTMVNYDPTDLLQLVDRKDEINLGCLIMDRAEIIQK